jgi:anti-anti-sigma factor
VTTTRFVSERLTVTVAFDQGQAVLGIQGTVDDLTAPEFSALLDAVIVSGYLSVVLDLTSLDLMDSVGLRVVTYATSRLVASGGALTMRTPSTMADQTVDISRLAQFVAQEFPPMVHERLGPEQSDNAPVSPVRGGHAASAHDLRRIGAIPADNDVVDGALRLVVNLARATVGGADGVSVSLRRHGRLATVAASDQTILDMDADQYETGEGPCVDASIEGRWFHAESLETETRWPVFTPRAHALGINAILSSPLLAQDRPVGALNIYSRAATAFHPDDQQLASTFATEASGILTEAGVDVADEDLTRRLAEAERTRQVITLAQGALMEREGVGEDRAYTLIREFSRRSSRPLRERAEDIMASTVRARVNLPGGPMEGDDA